jgi:hypothetical protein
MAKPAQKSSSAPGAYRIWFTPAPAAREAGPSDSAPSTPTATPAAVASAVPKDVLQRFTEPRPTLARRATVPLDEVLTGPTELKAAELWVLHLPPEVSEAERQQAHSWLAAGGGRRPIAARSAELGLFFCPGRAIISAAPESLDDALAGLAEFAFYEHELQQLEDEVAQRWTEVEADLPFVSSIDDGNKKLWPSLYGKLAHQHRLGMLASRIDHRLALLAHDRPPGLGRLLSRLGARARLRTRIEKLNNHLEVRDGVYDQIGYRLADHRGLRATLVIEVVIVVLLLMEVGISLYNLLSGAE